MYFILIYKKKVELHGPHYLHLRNVKSYNKPNNGNTFVYFLAKKYMNS